MFIGALIYGTGKLEALHTFIILVAETGNISIDVFFVTYAVLKHVFLNILIIALNKDLRKTFKTLIHDFAAKLTINCINNLSIAQ